MPKDQTIQERLKDLMENAGIDMDVYDLADFIQDVADLLADDIQKKEPYATETIGLLREGGRAISRNLGYTQESD